MTIISRSDFDMDLENYIARRKKESIVQDKKPEKKPKEKTGEEIKEKPDEENEHKKSALASFLDFLLGDEKEKNEMTEDKKDDVEEERTVKAKKGLFSFMDDWFGEENQKDETKEVSLVPEDIKDVLRLQNKWLAKLPPSAIMEFKDSGDYVVYKETLKKYKLLKEK